MMTTTPMAANGDPHPSNPTVRIPPWDFPDPTAHVQSPSSHCDAAAFAAFHRFLPSNAPDDGVLPAVDENSDCDFDFDFPVDAFSRDDFRMFEFKVRRCGRARSHDWTECPFAHPGEKARRRDPRTRRYSGSACPDFRRGACRKGDACEHAHGVFECWLHPARYRTQPCKDGIHCRRRICFFAHTPEQLRVVTGSPDGSPRRSEIDPLVVFGSSPTSTLFVSPPSSPTTGSPPIPPGESLCLSLQLSKMKMGLGLGLRMGPGLSTSPPSLWIGFGDPRSPSRIRPGFMSLPNTPIRAVNRSGPSPFGAWEEEPAMERVESGKALREKIYAKIGEDNSLDRADPVTAGPDFGWVRSLLNEQSGS